MKDVTHPTQRDIARETGFSQATISRVLRGDAAVTDETRTAVLAATERLGYRPSVGGRLLVSGRRAVVGISLAPAALPTDRYVSLLHQALTIELSSSGWAPLLVPPADLEARLDEIGALVIAGVERRDPRIARAAAKGVPVAAIGYPGDPAVSSVAPDDRDGGRQAVARAADLGRGRLAILSSAQGEGGPGMARRLEGALEEAGARGVATRVLRAGVEATPTLAGYVSARAMAADLAWADALFCDTDEHALGALAALRDMGRRVPEEITVIGFDDLPGLSARLTTVRQDIRAIAAEAVRLCRAEGEPSTVVCPVRLIARET